MSRKKTISILLVLLLMSCLAATTVALIQTNDTPISSGYGETIIVGLFPKISGDSLTITAILPPFGRMTIAKPRFDGHLGLLLVYGKYQWFANGPPGIAP